MSMHAAEAAPRARLRFGDFELDLRSLELFEGTHQIALQPRPAEVLAVLALARGEVVTHEQLRSRVWGEHAQIDVDQSIKTCIKQIRAVLGDDARHPAYIETLPRRGYRFIAPVEPLDDEEEGAAAAVPAEQERGRPRFGRVTFALALVVVVAAILLLRPDPPAGGAGEPVADSPAWGPWLMARQLLAGGGPEALTRAIRLLQEAERLDAEFAPAAASLAVAYTRVNTLSPGERFPAALAAAERALALAPDNAEAHLARGTARFLYEWKWHQARADLDTALAHDPELVAAHSVLAAWFTAAGEESRAVQEIAAMLAADPSSASLRADAGWYYYFLRRHEQAWRECSLAARLGAGSDAQVCMLLAAVAGSSMDRALVAGRTLLAALGAAPAELAAFDAASPPEALRFLYGFWLATLARRGGGWDKGVSDALVPLLLLERTPAALRALEQAIEERSSCLLPFLGVAPLFDSLRADPRFAELLGRVAPLSSRAPR